MVKQNLLPFACGLAGVIVGAALSRLPANQAAAADDPPDEPKPIVVSEVLVTDGKFGGPSVTIRPDGITLWSGNGVRMSTITSSAIELADDQDRRVWMNTNFRGNGGFVVLDRQGTPRAMLYGEKSGEGVVRLQGASGHNRAELRERPKGGVLQLYDSAGDPVLAAP